MSLEKFQPPQRHLYCAYLMNPTLWDKDTSTPLQEKNGANSLINFAQEHEVGRKL